ncbi:hypothetical protein ACQCSU_04910 [Pseudarthrobacter sp. O4]|uniref:hypothetical protein n=1 Tax=Pseudarthrobacter sp. O4 TaxID=3418417 RepID=UPI003CEDEDC7
MVITVDEHPLSLNLLLFIRHAWSIAADADIPALTPPPDPGASKMPESASIAEWTDRWRIAWNRAWGWYKIEDPDGTKHPTQEIMRQVLQPGQELHPLIPPFWTTEYDWDGLDRDAFNSWHRDLSPSIPNDAERQSLPDLIPAWETGLDTVIVLPYAGYFAQRITARRLAVSAATRNEPTTYSRALRESTP